MTLELKLFLHLPGRRCSLRATVLRTPLPWISELQTRKKRTNKRETNRVAASPAQSWDPCKSCTALVRFVSQVITNIDAPNSYQNEITNTCKRYVISVVESLNLDYLIQKDKVAPRKWTEVLLIKINTRCWYRGIDHEHVDLWLLDKSRCEGECFPFGQTPKNLHYWADDTWQSHLLDSGITEFWLAEIQAEHALCSYVNMTSTRGGARENLSSESSIYDFFLVSP